MSQLKTNSITHISNTGDPNIVLGDSGDTQVQSLNSGPIGGFRNQIINGDFRVWQRGTSVDVTASNNAYTADRFFVFSNTVATATVSQSTDAPLGAAYSMEMTANTSVVVHPVEVATGSDGPFTVGSTWTLSLWTKTNLTATTSPWRWRNDANGSSVNTDAIAGPCTWTATGETDGAWSRWSTTQTITTGNPAGGNCLVVYLPYAAQYSAVFNLALAQLEPGPVATPYEQRPISVELALCQRYFYKHEFASSAATAKGLVYKTAGGTSQAPLQVSYPVTMRANPTSDQSGLVVRSSTGAGASPSTKTAYCPGRNANMIYLGASGLATNTTGVIDFSGFFTVDAEL